MTAAGPHAGPRSGLSHVLKRGAAISAIVVIVCQASSIVQTLVVGRILGPDEIGVFAAGTVVVGVMLVAHSTLAQALVQREADIEHTANTVLVVTFATGLLLSLAVLAASPVIGSLFHSTRVGLIAAATSGLMFLHSCSSVPDALMQRAFQFKRRLVIAPTVSLVFATVSIVFAIAGYGAWALVIGTYASVITSVALNWWMAKWRPFRGRFSLRIWRELAGFSFPLLLSEIAERGREMCEQVLVGRTLGTADLGQFRYAYRIASLPSMAIVQICGYVLFPAFSRISGDRVRFRQAFLRALGWVWFAALPFGALLVVVGEPVVVLLLGDVWRPAGAATAAMAGLGVGTALTSVGWEAIKGAGRSSLLHWVTALTLVLGLGLILLLLPFGVVGVAIAISIAYLVIGLVCIELARSVTGVSYRETVTCLGPQTVSALAAFAVVFPVERFLVRSDHYAMLTGLGAIAAESLLFAVVYLGVLRVASPSRYRSVLGLAERAVNKLRGYR